MIKKVKLMAEWECWPLWGPPEYPGDIDPNKLPLSQGLKDELVAWKHAYDRIYDRDDPEASGFKSKEDSNAFWAEGERLFEALKRELPDYEVTFRDYRT